MFLSGLTFVSLPFGLLGPRNQGIKEWILTVVPIEPIVVVPMFFSIPAFPANQKQANLLF